MFDPLWGAALWHRDKCNRTLPTAGEMRSQPNRVPLTGTRDCSLGPNSVGLGAREHDRNVSIIIRHVTAPKEGSSASATQLLARAKWPRKVTA